MRSKFNRAVLTVALVILAGVVCRASDITYDVNVTGIGFDHGSVIGTLETDGTIGTLVASDFLSWNLEVSEPGTTSFDLTNGDSTLSLSGDAFSATSTELQYDFGVIGNFEIADGGDAFGLDSTSNPNNNFLFILPAQSASPEYMSTAVIATATPEPSTLGFSLVGLATLVWISRRSRPATSL
jgi:hypothetical protein